MSDVGKLTFFCGKMGAGKSTKAGKIALEQHAVLLSEDEWLASLYPNKIASFDDYLMYSSLLKPQIKKLVQSILSCGSDVVMDYPANTVGQRNWFRQIYSEVAANHQLIYLDISHQQCLDQIETRRKHHPERAKTDTKAMFEQVTKYFQPPRVDEGFTMITCRS